MASNWSKKVSPAMTRKRGITRLAVTLSENSRPDGLSVAAGLAHFHRWEAAVSEAVSLMQLESRGCNSYAPRGGCTKNCRDISDVLSVDATSRQALRAFVADFPEEQKFVEEALQFRAMVCTVVETFRAQEVAA
jgi:hypothetical protein